MSDPHGARADLVCDVVVVGGGVAGLSAAWRTARQGMSVVVVDPAPGTGATHASAGMLAPVSEVTYTEEPLLRLGLASLAAWPGFRAELDDESGVEVDHRREGTLEIAYSADDMAYFDRLAAFEETLGLRVERLTGRECRALEPMLSPAVRGGLLARDDAWINPRRLVRALLAAVQRWDGEILYDRATEIVPLGDGGGSGVGGGVGVRLGSGELVSAGHVVVAAGSWSPSLLPGLPVRPVKGQILRLRGPQGFLTRCVRGLVHGSPVYLVPRGDGEITLGATVEELAFDARVTAGGVYELLRDARELVPGISELELAETTVGFRPGTPDNLPLIGPAGPPGVLAATGHHRAGVLLAPVTAEAVVALVTGAGAPEVVKSCDPGRFSR
ncbi:glycine oxidase ThiO [Microbispora sp. ATCC PTA-5024]|uniref:glycine oxidase ThiO n=1 Tax=Microbispora sp. ATCC PTA-5024 TaxID=316330 RepID=UPI0003DD5C9D|nr:glycine oxidase ThiO [Microbispora sp. ATCC PTA-5024]ETK36324.1 glycine oxidase [Microbispora sp. ATCC PTA-5024]